MAKLLRKGFEKEVDCAQCGSRISISQEDIKLGFDWDGVGGNSAFFYAECPTCQSTTTLPIGLVPRVICDDLYQKYEKQRQEELKKDYSVSKS